MGDLTDDDRALLDFEQRWSFHRRAGAKDAAIRTELDLSWTQYSQRLLRLTSDPAAAVAYPTLIARLRRQLDARARQAGARRAS